MLIRRTTPADVEAVLDVWRSANRARGVESPPEHERIVREQLDRPATTSFLAADGDVIIGFVTGQTRTVRGVEVAGATQLLSLFVAPAAQGRGIGSRLIDALAEEAAMAGRPELHLWVRSDNLGARRLYERAGFTAGADVMDGDVSITAYVRAAGPQVSD